MTDISKVKNEEDLKNIAVRSDEKHTNLLDSYTEYKQRLDFELQKQAESFVRVGYLLKVARDTNVLKESGYKSVAEFAQAEYGLSKDVVSRYIAINDRYSENGYSDRLQVKYEGYGYSKLTEMLTLPDEIVSEIEPGLTRKEIQEIKKEIAEEEKISPMEVAMEAAEQEEQQMHSKTESVWLEYFRANRDSFIRLKAAIEENNTEKFVDALAPSGNAVLWARVPGTGRIMVTVNGEKDPVTMTNVRDLTKESQTVEEAIEDIKRLFGQIITKRAWEKAYGEIFDEETTKNRIKPHETAENDIKTKENVIKTEENVIKAAEPDKEGTDEGDEENNEKQKAEYEEREEEPATEPVTDFMPEPGTLGHLEVVKEEVAPVQLPEGDTHRIIEVTREVNKAEFGIADGTDHAECKEKLEQGLKNFKDYLSEIAGKIQRTRAFRWDDSRLYDELIELFEDALNRSQEAKAALAFIRKTEREEGEKE